MPSSAAASVPPEGLIYEPEFIGEDEERMLLTAIGELPFHQVRMHGVVARRTVIHFGWDYGYESWKIEPAEPLPPVLLPLRARCADVIGRHPQELEQTLVARYPPGAGIGWHRDAPMFGPEVVGVSLGSECAMRFRRKAGESFEVWVQQLEPRSLYVLRGPARKEWQHMIRQAPELRHSVTFRTVRSGWKKSQ
jgi:DNA oxidative demethylase